MDTAVISFDERIAEAGLSPLQKGPIEILQVNVGKLCNLTCNHCHVQAGPSKTAENMSRETAEAVVEAMDVLKTRTLDLTGGAPELNPHFRFLVREAKRRQLHVIDRANLTVFYEPGMQEMPDFLKHHKVEVIASLPCYSRDNVDKQRGDGTFQRSIQALQWLNRLGYGQSEDLPLNLVYNPVGAALPPAQKELEVEYRERLGEDFDIAFNHLYTITNMPITRFAKYLKAFGKLESYQKLLEDSFNSAAVPGLMCKNTLNVGWDGKLYDCDFNQVLEMGLPVRISDLAKNKLLLKPIRTGNHCFGCTAGAGSSCQGSLVEIGV